MYSSVCEKEGTGHLLFYPRRNLVRGGGDVWGPLCLRAQMFPRIRHYETSMDKVRVGLSGKQGILAKMPFEVNYLNYI